MKVLFITYHYLSGNGGGQFASRAFINAFSEISDELMLIYPDNGEDIKDNLDNRIIFHPIRSKKSVFIKAINLLFGKLHKIDFNILKNEILDKHIFNLIVFYTCMMGDLTQKIKHLGYKTLTIHHNVQTDYYKDNKKSFLFNALGCFGYWVKKNEYYALRFSDVNLTLTESDAVKLSTIYKLSPSIIIINIGCFEFSTNKNQNLNENTTIGQLCFIITGNLSAIQTENSLIPFIKTYYPIIQNDFPEHLLIIAGKDPSNNLSKLLSNYPQIQLIPNPEKIIDIIVRGTIYICPISLGSGIKLRVMDGLKSGLPVLTHITSERGYEELKKLGYIFSYYDTVSFRIALSKSIQTATELKKSELITSYINQFSFDAGVKRLKIILKEYGLNF